MVLPSALQRLTGPGRRAAWRRRVARKAVSAAVAVVAVLVALSLARPSTADGEVPVLVAARDLAAGSLAGMSDVRLEPRRVRDVPPAALRSPSQVIGRAVAGPVAAGEMLTSARLVGGGLLAGSPAGKVAVHLGATDPGVLGMLADGDRVDVYVAGKEEPVARAALVLAKDADPTHGGVSALGGRSDGVGLVAAVDGAEASRVAAASQPDGGVTGFTFVLRPH